MLPYTWYPYAGGYCPTYGTHMLVPSHPWYRTARTKCMTRTKRKMRRMRMKLTFGPVPSEVPMASSKEISKTCKRMSVPSK